MAAMDQLLVALDVDTAADALSLAVSTSSATSS